MSYPEFKTVHWLTYHSQDCIARRACVCMYAYVWLYTDFIVKFSPSVCVAVVASLTGEMATPSFAYHADGTADSDKSCCYPWFVCHDKTLNQQCILARPPTIIKSSDY